MTDTDPRLEAAVAAAYDDKSLVNLSSITFTEARRFLAMLRAALPWLRDALRAFDQARPQRLTIDEAKVQELLRIRRPDGSYGFADVNKPQPESEVMPHSGPRQQPTEHNATVPVMGADPPWLDEAAVAARNAWYGDSRMAERFTGNRDDWRNAVRAVLAFANALPPS